MVTHSGIGHRFWLMFSLLVAVICVVTAVGVYAAASSGRQAIARQELQREAAYLRAQRAADPRAPLPDTWLIRGYLHPAQGSDDVVPAYLRDLAPGFHQVRQPDGVVGTVLVEADPQGTLYLLFNNDRPNRVVVAFGLVPVVLVVLMIYVAGWLTYRASRRALSPVIALADAVRAWDPDHPDLGSLATAKLPAASDADVAVLGAALTGFARRLDAFVERERNFTRDASHELRTPLTVMKVAVDVLADEPLDPFAQRALARARRAVREMEALIETFLVLAREADTGLPDEDFLANDVVAAEVARYRELLGAKPVDIVFTESARFALHAPPRVFAVMVGNLVRNACLYTEQGRITVSVGFGEVSVADTGVGMSADDLERAFQPFYRGGREDGVGHGIGLAIVRRVADRYGWRVSLASTLGAGTTATAHFPAAQLPDAALPPPTPAHGANDEPKQR